jgi:hypothetical protein
MSKTGIHVAILGLLCLLTYSHVSFVTHAQDADESGCPTALSLATGQPITIIGGVYIRAEPTLDAGIVSYSPDRILATVIDGPVCEDNIIWWNVQRVFEDPTFTGWVAQSANGKQFVLPNTPLDSDSICPDPLPVPINSAIATFDGIRVREEPSTSARVLTVAQADTTALVLEGPTCNEGFNWWRVQLEVVGVPYTGWIVEGIPYSPEGESIPFNDPLLVDPLPDAGPVDIPCGPSGPLQIGAIGVLRFRGEPMKNLRVAPDTSAHVLYTLPSGIQAEILSEPFCNEGVNWRRIRVIGGSVQPVGWLAEGDWLGRFLGPNGEDYGQPAP